MTHTSNLILKIFFGAFLFLSCNDKQTNQNNLNEQTVSWTEYQKRKYFQDSIAYRLYNGAFRQGDSINKFETFSRIMYSDIRAKNLGNAFVYAFEEPYIDTTKIDTAKNWFRIIVDPTFCTAYCIIIELKFNKTYFTLKTTDGHGGYYSGVLNFSGTKIYSDTVYKNISKLLNEASFWKLKGLPKNAGCVTDADSWTFEAIEKGQYNILELSEPIYCGDSSTMAIGQIGLLLKQKAKSIKMASFGEIIREEKEK